MFPVRFLLYLVKGLYYPKKVVAGIFTIFFYIFEVQTNRLQRSGATKISISNIHSSHRFSLLIKSLINF